MPMHPPLCSTILILVHFSVFSQQSNSHITTPSEALCKHIQSGRQPLIAFSETRQGLFLFTANYAGFTRIPRQHLNTGTNLSLDLRDLEHLQLAGQLHLPRQTTTSALGAFLIDVEAHINSQYLPWKGINLAVPVSTSGTSRRTWTDLHTVDLNDMIIKSKTVFQVTTSNGDAPSGRPFSVYDPDGGHSDEYVQVAQPHFTEGRLKRFKFYRSRSTMIKPRPDAVFESMSGYQINDSLPPSEVGYVHLAENFMLGFSWHNRSVIYYGLLTSTIKPVVRPFKSFFICTDEDLGITKVTSNLTTSTADRSTRASLKPDDESDLPLWIVGLIAGAVGILFLVVLLGGGYWWMVKRRRGRRRRKRKRGRHRKHKKRHRGGQTDQVKIKWKLYSPKISTGKEESTLKRTTTSTTPTIDSKVPAPPTSSVMIIEASPAAAVADTPPTTKLSIVKSTANSPPTKADGTRQVT